MVFSEKQSEILPPHRKSNMKIKLVQDATLPFGPIYSLFNLELQKLKCYLDEHIARGFIEPSTSPTSSPVLFPNVRMFHLYGPLQNTTLLIYLNQAFKT
jgi:hypothetical protein